MQFRYLTSMQGDFADTFVKKLAFFLKTNAMIYFKKILTVF
jgi:hypothetical protein